MTPEERAEKALADVPRYVLEDHPARLEQGACGMWCYRHDAFTACAAAIREAEKETVQAVKSHPRRTFYYGDWADDEDEPLAAIARAVADELERREGERLSKYLEWWDSVMRRKP